MSLTDQCELESCQGIGQLPQLPSPPPNLPAPYPTYTHTDTHTPPKMRKSDPRSQSGSPLCQWVRVVRMKMETRRVREHCAEGSSGREKVKGHSPVPPTSL